MADQYQIRCIKKTDRYNPHERIRAVGGFDGGKNWMLSQEQAIEGIESGKWQFYVQPPGGHRAWVVVARSQHGYRYLKTQADGEQPNNLLSLPECV